MPPSLQRECGDYKRVLLHVTFYVGSGDRSYAIRLEELVLLPTELSP